MPSAAQQKTSFEQELVETCARLAYEPDKWVLWAYPWGMSGTPLAQDDGPDRWQIEQLQYLGQCLMEGKSCRDATASGKGIGKSADVAWNIQFLMSTIPNCSGRVTAGTAPQLASTTWREVAKWHKLMLNKHWFNWTATKFYHVDYPETWSTMCIPWSLDNPEAFQGQHERGYPGKVFTLFDEASQIPSVIWDAAEGIFTTEGAVMLAYGNPTRNTGDFYDIFHRKKNWNRRKVDSRQSKIANQNQIQEWIEYYGEDSDRVRVWVKGDFPKSSSTQFIPPEYVEKSRKHEADGFEYFPTVVGVDVARFGDDESVICTRQGRKVFPLKRYQGVDLMTFSAFVAEHIKEVNPQAVFVDSVGVGAGVCDRLRQLGFSIIEVNAGNKADDESKYRNKRIEMWDRMKSALRETIELPDDDALAQELTGPEYGFTDRGLMQLERKVDMKMRGLGSPDAADALALTYAYPVILPQDDIETEPESFPD